MSPRLGAYARHLQMLKDRKAVPPVAASQRWRLVDEAVCVHCGASSKASYPAGVIAAGRWLCKACKRYQPDAQPQEPKILTEEEAHERTSPYGLAYWHRDVLEQPRLLDEEEAL